MKITFEITEEDEIETKYALCHANRNYYILWELKRNFHRHFKYEGEKMPDGYMDGVNDVLEKLHKELDEFIEP